MLHIPKPYEIYQHFKGNLYQIIALAEHSETGEKMVVYQALYAPFKVYTRPLNMFLEGVDKVKYPDAGQNERFRLVTEQSMETSDLTGLQGAPEVSASQAPDSSEEEVQIDPMVLQFLEADSYAERLQILAGLHHRISHEMINTMAVATDIEVPEGELESRYEELRNCLLTLEKYECNRLR
ncbi:MAG: DUF1653 domain-containing protein [Lachnospiraceae bacterium]|nr:DUF1653 domain-containing protein [Lachnospiraceae bacterium]